MRRNTPKVLMVALCRSLGRRTSMFSGVRLPLASTPLGAAVLGAHETQRSDRFDTPQYYTLILSTQLC